MLSPLLLSSKNRVKSRSNQISDSSKSAGITGTRNLGERTCVVCLRVGEREVTMRVLVENPKKPEITLHSFCHWADPLSHSCLKNGGSVLVGGTDGLQGRGHQGEQRA